MGTLFNKNLLLFQLSLGLTVASLVVIVVDNLLTEEKKVTMISSKLITKFCITSRI